MIRIAAGKECEGMNNINNPKEIMNAVQPVRYELEMYYEQGKAALLVIKDAPYMSGSKYGACVVDMSVAPYTVCEAIRDLKESQDAEARGEFSVCVLPEFSDLYGRVGVEFYYDGKTPYDNPRLRLYEINRRNKWFSVYGESTYETVLGMYSEDAQFEVLLFRATAAKKCGRDIPRYIVVSGVSENEKWNNERWSDCEGDSFVSLKAFENCEGHFFPTHDYAKAWSDFQTEAAQLAMDEFEHLKAKDAPHSDEDEVDWQMTAVFNP